MRIRMSRSAISGKALLSDEELSVIHDMSFFVWNGQSYDRYDETHEQKTFYIEEYEQMLAETGFELKKVTADFTDLASFNRV